MNNDSTPSSSPKQKLPPSRGGFKLDHTQLAEHIHILAIDTFHHALIFENSSPNTIHGDWQVLSGKIAPQENPWTAVDRILLDTAGLRTNRWTYLSSYIAGEDGNSAVEHFFCANEVTPVKESPLTKGRWISLIDLKRALVDGRISSINQAASVALALLHLM